MGLGFYPDLRAVGLLGAHVGDGGRVFTDQDHVKPHGAAPRLESPYALRDLRPHLCGGGFAVKDSRHGPWRRGTEHGSWPGLFRDDRANVQPPKSSSVLAAIMKSFWCSPPILCVHQVTVTLPHSVNNAGWWPSSSACSPTLLVKASAWAKLRNLNTRSRRLMPSRCTTCHSGTCERSSAISASVSVGSSPRQAVHFISDSSLMSSSFL